VRQLLPAGLSFIVNGKPDGSSAGEDLWTEVGSVELAALAHPRPRTALIIGLGTGISAGAMLLHPGIEEVHVVEIEPLQLEVARRFAPYNRNALDHRKMRMHLDDARHFLLTDRRKYDLIIGEPSNLWISGMVNLYTVEALSLARRRLAPGGIMLQWLHYYQIGEADLLGALATFQAVFPNTTFWMHEAGDCFMVGTETPLAIDLADWQRRVRDPVVAADLSRSGLADPLALLAFYRLGPADVARDTRGATLCRDDFPFLEFTTPRVGWSALTTINRRLFLRELAVSDPLPLVRESAADRVRLGKAFLAAADLARARLEFSRALVLNPGSGEARRGLANIREYYSANPKSP